MNTDRASYVVWNPETGRVYRSCSTKLAAAASNAANLRKGKPSTYDTKVIFDAQDTDVVVHNLMSGKPVVQKRSTPLCCDVSSETYWSM
jgi:hypothetical protein